MARRLPPDLVALYAGPERRPAVLLRHTLVPLFEERPAWLAETTAAARGVAEALGVPPAALIVLQWRLPREVLRITREWRGVWVGDPARLHELIEVARRRVEDDGFVAEAEATGYRSWRATPGPSTSTPALARPLGPLATFWPGVAAWYRAMAACWLGIEPPTRRALVLRTHEWTVESLLTPRAPRSRIVLDLYPVLLRCLPEEEPGRWDPWIRLVTDDLGRAAAVPHSGRDETWARHLLLIPYGLPTPRPAQPV